MLTQNFPRQFDHQEEHQKVAYLQIQPHHKFSQSTTGNEVTVFFELFSLVVSSLPRNCTTYSYLLLSMQAEF